MDGSFSDVDLVLARMIDNIYAKKKMERRGDRAEKITHNHLTRKEAKR